MLSSCCSLNSLFPYKVVSYDYETGLDNAQKVLEGNIKELSLKKMKKYNNDKDIIIVMDKGGNYTEFPQTVPFLNGALEGEWNGRIYYPGDNKKVHLDFCYAPFDSTGNAGFFDIVFDSYAKNVSSMFDIQIKPFSKAYAFYLFPRQKQSSSIFDTVENYTHDDLPVRYSEFDIDRKKFYVLFTKMRRYSQSETFNSMSRTKSQTCIITDENGKIYADFDRTSYRLYCYDDYFDEKQLLPCIGVYSLILRLFHEE